MALSPRIRLSLSRLTGVLEKLAPLQSETIKSVLSANSLQWETLATQNTWKEEVKDEELSEASVIAFYAERTKGVENHVPLNTMLELSRTLSIDVPDYRHNMLQASIAGVVLSNVKKFTIVVSPTGSGKTWI